MDDRLFAELLDRYAPLVCSVAVRYGLQPAEVDDVYQTTVEWAWEHRYKVDDLQHVPRWLATVARFKTLEFLRQQQRAAGVSIEQVSDPVDQGALPEDMAIAAEDTGRLLDALERITPKQRMLIELMFLSPRPLSYAEIAERLSVSVGTLGRMRRRALDRLRKLLSAP